MAIMDELTAHWYEVLELRMQHQNGKVTASYTIAIRNVLSQRMTIINCDSTLTAQERQAVVAIFQRDVAAFEAATGLEKWEEPE